MNPRKPEPRARLLAAAAAVFAFTLTAATAWAAAPLYEENFSYTAGTNLNGQGGWSAFSGAGNNPITIGTPGLTYAGYPSSGIGNRAGTTATSGEDDAHGFAGQSSGTVYAALLINVQSSQTTGDYFFHYFDGPVGSNVFRGRVFARKSASTTSYALGLQFGNSGSPVYTGFDYAPGTTHLIVLKYTFVGGAGNDQVDLFVDPAISGSEPGATLTSSSAGQVDATNLDALAIRQGTNSRAPTVQIDGIRVATNWSDAVAAISTITTSVNPPAGGSITPAGPFGIPFGGSQTFTIAANSCYSISGVTVDGNSQGAISGYTFTNSDGVDHTLAATFSVNAATPVTVSVSSDVNPSVWSDPVTFTATVSPSNATGTVTFRDSLLFMGTASISGGQAQIVKSNLRPGNHTAITATYNGDLCHLSGVSPAFSQLVNRHTSDCGVSAEFNPKVCGQTVRLSGIVTPIGVTGTCTFRVDGNFQGTAPVNPITGIATLPVGNMLAGKHSITVEYSGDAHYIPSSSPEYSITCASNPSAVTMTTDITPAKYGQQVTLTAMVQPDDAFGTVDFFDGITPLGTGDVGADHMAHYSFTTQLAPGTHHLHAVYSGDGCHDPSTSPEIVQDITPDQQPVVTVLFPNGHETFCITGDHKLTWTATDNGTVTSVMIEVSRDFGGTWQTLVASMPNTGSYVWHVDPPSTGGPQLVYSALIRVTATDNAGITGSDESDGFFAISDCALAVTVTRLETESLEMGVRIRWAFSEPQAFASVAIERSASEQGPWSAISADVGDDAGGSMAVDRSVAANQTYYYRVIGTSASGSRMTYGPVRGTAGAPREFALSAAWPNPSRGPLTLKFSVPREADVRLSVVDLQGREVEVLTKGAHPAGVYQVDWDGRTDRGPVPAGLYFIRLVTPDKNLVNRVTFAR